MSVNSVDYSKELSRLRDQYKKSIDSNREAQINEKERLEDNFQGKHKKELAVFRNEKNELERSFDKRLDDIKKNTKELINDNRTNYLENLEKERHNFEKSKIVQKNDFNKKIDEIGESFRRANFQEKEEHNAIQGNARKNYANRMVAQNDQHMKEIDLMGQRSKKVDEEAKSKSRDEQEKLFKTHQVEIQDTKKEEVNRRLQDLAKKEEENRLLKDFYSGELDLKTKLNEGNIESIKKKNDETMFRLQESFEDMSNSMREKAVQNEDRSQKEYSEKLGEQARLFDKEKNFLNKRVYDIARAKDVEEDTRKGAELKSRKDDNLDRYNQNLDTIRKDFYSKNEDARKSYLEDLDRTKISAENKSTKERMEAGKFLVQQSAKDTKERNDTVDIYKRQNKEATKNFDRLLDQQRKFSSQRVKDGITDFNEKINQMNEVNYETLNKVREKYVEEQKDLIVKNELGRVDLSEELKRTYTGKIEDSNRQFAERMKQKNIELKNTIENYESTIKSLEEARVRNDRYREFLYNEKSKEDLEGWKAEFKKKDEEHQLFLEGIRNEYEDRIDQLQSNHINYVKKLSSIQNDMINRMQAEKLLELKRTEKNNKQEQDRISSEGKMRLDQMQISYEDKIRQLKDNYENEISKLKTKIESIGG